VALASTHLAVEFVLTRCVVRDAGLAALLPAKGCLSSIDPQGGKPRPAKPHWSWRGESASAVAEYITKSWWRSASKGRVLRASCGSRPFWGSAETLPIWSRNLLASIPLLA